MTSDHSLPLVDRLYQQGSSSLTPDELLALILNTPDSRRTAEQILHICGGLAGLSTLTAEQTHQIQRLSPLQGAQLLAVAELIRRAHTHPTQERPVIESAEDAAALLADMRDLTQEQVRVILLDTHRRVMGTATVYIGTLNRSAWRASEIFREAMVRGSAAIVLAHNHPSGNPTPSPEDVQATRLLIAAGRLLDIPLLDHVIIGQEGWVSLKTLGLIG
ncbi:MAG: DNA repair protein RadC [Anaerolineae bacterium]